MRVTVLSGPPRGTTQTRCSPHPAKTSHATRRRNDPLLALSERRFQGDVLTAHPAKTLHSQGGDGAFRIVPHPRAGHVLVANFDIPRGYKTVFWGTRKTWKATEGKEGEDYAMCFRTNGGVIDPTTHKRGSQMQFMSNPGPNERQNMRSTNEFYGKTYEDGLVGREFVVMHDVKKNHQLLIWYGYSWFDARGIDRIDVGTKRYPATLRETKDEKDAKKAKKKSSVAKTAKAAKPPLGDATNAREKADAAG